MACMCSLYFVRTHFIKNTLNNLSKPNYNNLTFRFVIEEKWTGTTGASGDFDVRSSIVSVQSVVESNASFISCDSIHQDPENFFIDRP